MLLKKANCILLLTIFYTVVFHLIGGNLESNFSTVDVLRKRLHEKIEESRGQVCSI